MVGLESPGPTARDAAPAVALEDVATDSLPAAAGEAGMVMAHAIARIIRGGSDFGVADVA